MTKRATVILAVLVLALLVPSGVALAKSYKFTFDNVTFSDGTQGVIEAGSKVTQVNNTDSAEFTVCEYYSSGYADYLGMYQSDSFFSTDGPTVEQFCLNYFANRQ